MDGGNFDEYMPTSKPEKFHYLVEMLTFGVMVVLLILMIALIVLVVKYKKSEKFASKQQIVRELRQSNSLFGGEKMTIQQKRDEVLRGLQGQEHMSPDLIKRQLASRFEDMSPELIKRNLAGGIGTENFINDLPMLGGGKLTDGAVALRAADPIVSEPISPSQQQYMKENELLEVLLYK